MNVLAVGELDPAQLSALAILLARCDEADGHPALAEPQRAASARADLGGAGWGALLGYDGDQLTSCAILSPAGDGSTALHLAVDPDHRAGPDRRAALVTTALAQVPGTIRLWVMQASDHDDAEVGALGFRPERDLLQMRVPLPLPEATVSATKPIATRAFVPGQDDQEWLAINNRAFAGHPEQGGWTHEQLQARLEADWFDPAGFRIAPSPDGNGFIGSCWTKVHRTHRLVLGEIYVISVDPSQHGHGWGRALTVAGLEWLAGQGVPVGMLYTDASNTTAVALYLSLGFTVDHRDRSYRHGAAS